jgi:AcrR family transcriptional regulator
VLRGERTRDAIADALLELLEAGVPQPTARQIAERAGVSLRSVFQHFDDLEALYAACVRHQYARIAPLMSPIDPDLPLTERVEAFAAQRARLYERIAPVRRAVRTASPTSPALRDGLERMTVEHRRDVETLFAPEVVRRESRREVVAALEVATSFDTWDHLRQAQGCSVTVARGAVARLLRGVLEDS